MKEGIDGILERGGLLRYSRYVVGAVSSVMMVILLLVVLLPLFLNTV